MDEVNNLLDIVVQDFNNFSEAMAAVPISSGTMQSIATKIDSVNAEINSLKQFLSTIELS